MKIRSISFQLEMSKKFSNSVLPIIQKYASADLLGKVHPETLCKTFADLWQTLEAIQASALIADGGEICPNLGLDVLILKDPRFANRTGKTGPLPNDGKGSFDQDAPADHGQRHAQLLQPDGS